MQFGSNTNRRVPLWSEQPYLRVINWTYHGFTPDIEFFNPNAKTSRLFLEGDWYGPSGPAAFGLSEKIASLTTSVSNGGLVSTYIVSLASITWSTVDLHEISESSLLNRRISGSADLRPLFPNLHFTSLSGGCEYGQFLITDVFSLSSLFSLVPRRDFCF